MIKPVTTQKEFNFVTSVLTADELIEYLNNGVKPLVEVVFTKNKVSMISLRLSPDRKLVKIRMHEEFLKAPFKVLESLRKYIKTGRRAHWSEVSSYAAVIPTTAKKPVRQKRLVTAGEIYDLKEILDEVKRELFSGRVQSNISWGRSRAQSRRRRRSVSIRFGSWDSITRTIRIHPILDDKRVPREFVKYIVYHELLHAVVPGKIKNNRRYDHSPEFRKMEQSYPNYQEMKRLSRKLLDILI